MIIIIQKLKQLFKEDNTGVYNRKEYEKGDQFCVSTTKTRKYQNSNNTRHHNSYKTRIYPEEYVSIVTENFDDDRCSKSEDDSMSNKHEHDIII